MHSSEFPITLLPKSVRDKIKFKRYKKGEFIYEDGDEKVFYIKKGRGMKIRCDEDGEKVFPYIFSDDEFIGVNAYFTGGSDWEVIAYSKEVTGFEIPKSIFKEYILSTPLFTEEYLPKCVKLLFQGLRGFYIDSQGGAAAYYAYVLSCFCKESNIFHFDSYTELTKAVYVNKSTLYKITNQFIDEGIIEKYKNSIKIINREALVKYFDTYKY
ncbi:Crp/Fnr family transcriptional regulator [Ilyobacter polytropus]|uniref:Transcriptional regulator, Crp/Fnr family n=1 Tax=Ilyobacter polytropus (strain ATCC 51220 / DSM 2926 / LMG 16218 / CuHBu1) TaxID=572544 RepID=E3H681_ILYPC|nr:cyclic nucleotide-binding domain-containing protein [Ilyobacter polytropus]ADO81840.1 putative transcriptional regulator, Crp/Fnr family [Ilyobacter polytropus DSM 2926]